jgi:hypothetical protein
VSQPAPKRYQAHPLYITARKGESLWGIVNKIAIRGCMTGRDASGKAQWDRDCIKSKLVTDNDGQVLLFSHKHLAQDHLKSLARKHRDSTNTYMVIEVKRS